MYVFSCDCVCGKGMGWVGRKDIKDQRAQIMREREMAKWKKMTKWLSSSKKFLCNSIKKNVL